MKTWSDSNSGPGFGFGEEVVLGLVDWINKF